MQYSNSLRSRSAFTLIEMLIIIPITMLVVAGIVVGITVITSDGLQVRSQTNGAYESQSALNDIERNVYRSLALPAAITGLSAGQGFNSSTGTPADATQFTAATTNPAVLLLRLPAVDKSPLDPSRTVLYSSTPNACGSGATSNNIYPVTLAYFVKSGVLYERTITTTDLGAGYSAYSSLCSNVGSATGWYRATCPEGVSQAACTTSDTPLASNVTSFTFSYIDKSGTVVAQSSASGVVVTLTSSRRIAGRDIPLTLTLNAQSSNL